MKLGMLSKVSIFALLAAFAMNTGYTENQLGSYASEKAASGVISSLTMALGTTGESLEPENVSSVFRGTDTIHAVVRVVNAPADTKVRSMWYVVDVGGAADPDTLIDTTEIIVDGTRNIDFTLKPTTSLPTGIYEVEILVNGIKDTTKQFHIK